MKKFYLGVFLFLAVVQTAFTQSRSATGYKGLYIVNGNDWSNPDDYTTIGYWNRTNYTIFDSVLANSVQDVYTDQEFTFVLADTFLIRYKNEVFNRDTIVETRAGNVLATTDSFLIIGYHDGLVEGDSAYLKVFNKKTLNTIKNFTDVTTDVSDIIIREDKAYIAISGNWMSTTGKIGVIDLSTMTTDTIIDLDSLGHGISQLFLGQHTLHAICGKGYGDTVGYIHTIQLDDHSISSKNIDHKIGGGIKHYDAFSEHKIIQNHLGGEVLLKINGKVALYDLAKDSIIDNSYINKSYATGVHVIGSGANETVITQTDYYSFGQALLYEGKDSVDMVPLQISPEGIAAYFDKFVAVEEIENYNVAIYPNPTTDYLFIETNEVKTANLYDLSGRSLIHTQLQQGRNTLNVKSLTRGIYILDIEGTSSQKIIIQ